MMDGMPKPNAHLSTIRSRVNRLGLRMRKIAKDRFIVVDGDKVLTPVSNLQELEKWSWYKLQGLKYDLPLLHPVTDCPFCGRHD